MLMTKRKPATIGEILVEEFMKPIGLTQGALAEAMGVQRKHVNELCNDRRNAIPPHRDCKGPGRGDFLFSRESKPNSSKIGSKSLH